MENNQTSPIDEYISGFPSDRRKLLNAVRDAIRKAAPEAEEAISYGVPTFKLHGNLVHFASFKNHIGFFPAPSGIEAFKKELASYKGAKGSVQFPLDQPLPLTLITNIVRFRVKENIDKKKPSQKKNS